MQSEALSNRTFGENLKVSVATAQALELTVFAEDSKVKTLWMNVRTLARNLYESIDNVLGVNVDELNGALVEEIEIIHSLLKAASIKGVFYSTRYYTGLEKDFPSASVKQPKTDKQKREELVLSVMTAYASDTVKAETFKRKIYAGENGVCHMLTHNPLDLLSLYEFGELLLLESHTGQVKDRLDWITKLTDRETFHFLPFNMLTIQVLGDQAKLFYSMSESIKSDLLEIATKNSWGPKTSYEKVMSDVKRSNSKNRDLFISLLSTKLK